MSIWIATMLGLSPSLAVPAEPLPEPTPAEPGWRAEALEAAAAYVGEIPEGLDLQAHTIRFAGGHRARIRYRLHGRTVYGASLSVAAPLAGVARVAGPVPQWSTTSAPSVGRAEALQIAEAHSSWSPWHAELAYLADGDDLVLAWRVPIQRRPGAVPSPHDVWVDALDGQVVRLVPTGHAAEGLLYPQNPVTSEVARWTLPSTNLSSAYAQAASCSATDPDVSVLELAACEVIEVQAQPDDQGDYLFVPRPEAARDPFAEVGAFAHVDAMSTWLDQEFGMQVAWAPIDVFVNFPLANAFFGDFDGDGAPDVSFGHARGADLAYDADVVYHELGHAVVGTLAPDLPFLQADETGLDWVSGSINEGAADAFAMLLTGDPAVGEYAGRAFGYDTSIRDLTQSRRCPDDLVGAVHTDGEVFGALFWGMILDEQVGSEVAAELLMGTIPLWDADPSWPKVGASLRETSLDLRTAEAITEATHDAIEDHLAASGIVDCARVVDLAPGDFKELRVYNAGLGGDLERFVGSVQLRLEPGEARWVLEIDQRGSRAVGWSVFLRRGAPVEHRPLDVSGLGLTAAIPEVYDELFDGVGRGEVELPSGTDPLYVMMASRNIDAEPLNLTSIALDVSVREDRASVVPSNQAPRALRHEGGCSTSAGWPGSWPLARRRDPAPLSCGPEEG